MILFYYGANLCLIYEKLIIGFVKLNALIGSPDGWPEKGGQRRG
jgi:hypothetical protein